MADDEEKNNADAEVVALNVPLLKRPGDMHQLFSVLLSGLSLGGEFFGRREPARPPAGNSTAELMQYCEQVEREAREREALRPLRDAARELAMQGAALAEEHRQAVAHNPDAKVLALDAKRGAARDDAGDEE